MVHFIEETLQVYVNDMPVSLFNIGLNLQDGLPGAFPRPESITEVRKFRLKLWAEFLVDRLLDHPVKGRWNPK